MSRFVRLEFLMTTCLFIAFTAYTQTTRYVSPSGQDSGNCTDSNNPCRSIRYALSQAQAGNTIQVAAGTYDASTEGAANIVIDKSVILLGAQADVSPNLPTSVRTAICSQPATASESVIEDVNIQITADGVLINGFELRYAYIEADGSDLDIRYCMITPQANEVAIRRVGTVTRTNWILEENRIGQLSGATMNERGMWLHHIDGLLLQRNYVWRADGAFDLEEIQNADVFENVVNFGAEWGSNVIPSCSIADNRGAPQPDGSMDIFVSHFGLRIRGVSSHIRVERNEFSILLSNSQPDEGMIVLHASQLNGKCHFKNNILNGGGLPTITIPDAYSSYAHEYILFRENIIDGNTAANLGNGSPTGRIDANANNWGLKAMGNPAEKDLFMQGSTAALDAFETITFFTIVGSSGDLDLPAYGYQSSRELSYYSGSGGNTLQEAILAVPSDPQSRWALYLNSDYGTQINISNATTIDRPMIMRGIIPNKLMVTLNNTSSTEPMLVIASDSVMLDDMHLRLSSTSKQTVAVKGSNQVLIKKIDFIVDNTSTDFVHLYVDSETTKPVAEQNSVRVEDCIFRSTSTAGEGIGIAIYNSNKPAPGQPQPVYESIQLHNNTFEANLQYYIYLDGELNREVDADISIATNFFGGLQASAMNAAQRYALIDKIIDGADVYNTGYCYIQPNVGYVTLNSFFPPYTTSPDLSRVISRLQDGGEVRFNPGNYPHVVVVEGKEITLIPDGNALFTVNGFDMNAAGKQLMLAAPVTVNANGSIVLTAGHIHRTDTSYAFTIRRGTVVSGGSNESYIRGRVFWDLSGGSGPTVAHFPIGEVGQNQYRGIILHDIEGNALLSALTSTSGSIPGSTKGAGVDDIFSTRYWLLSRHSGSISTNGEVEVFFGMAENVNAERFSYLAVAQSSGITGPYEALLPASKNTYPRGSVRGPHQNIVANNYFTLVVSCPTDAPISPVAEALSDFYDAAQRKVYFCQGQVRLQAEGGDENFSYQWQSSSNGNDWFNIPGATTFTYDANAVGFYRYQAQDICFALLSDPIEVVNPTAPSISVRDANNQAITGPVQVFLGEQITLRLVLEGAVHGLERVSWSPTAGIDDPEAFEIVLTAVNPGSTIYTASVRYGVGCLVQVSVEVIGVADYFLPNAFSPNGDGVNDKLKFYGFGVESLHFKVFDRFGRLVYETRRKEDLMDVGWDGRSLSGQELPGGVYIWELRAIRLNGELITLDGKTHGTLMLLR